MNYLDLFSGIGGFALGAYWAGMKFDKHYCSEIDPYCVELYKKRFPDSIQLGDITKIKTEDLPDGEWIITGGFPCQDISIAGKGEGITGARSGLWFEYWRIIRDLRPRFAIMENVGMLVHRGLREVLGSLAEIGYNAEWQDIRAEDMGAPHRRERIWIVAYPGYLRRGDEESEAIRESEENRMQCDKITGSGKMGEVPDTELSGNRASRDGINRDREKKKQEREYKSQSKFGRYSKEISDTKIERLQRRSDGGNARSQQPGLGESSRSVSGNWLPESGFCRVANGVPSRVDRLKGLGNAIVPQIAELLFLQIKDLLDE